MKKIMNLSVLFAAIFCLANIQSKAVCVLNSIPTAGVNTMCGDGISNILLKRTGTCPGAITWSISPGTAATVTGSGSTATVQSVISFSTVIETVTCTSGGVPVHYTITVNPLPAVTIGGTTPICVTGSSVTFTESPAFSGTWNTSDNSIATVGGSTGVVTPVGPGFVNILYTAVSSFGCTSTATFALTVDPLPSVTSITGGLSIWPSTTTTLLASGAGVGTWSSSATGTATVVSGGLGIGTVTGVATGIANISYLVNNSCGSAFNFVPVTVNALPTMPSTSVYTVTTASAVAGLNTAMIEATPVSYSGTGGYVSVQAFAWWDGSGTNAGTLRVADINLSGTANYYSTTPVLTYTPTNTPDVVIGNDASSVNDYIVAVAYPTGTSVVIDIFKWTIGSGFTSSTPLYVFSRPIAANVVHIDGIADHNSTGITGRPYCSHAVVAFDDASTGAVLAGYIDLQTTSGGLFQRDIVGVGTEPDVAGIKRSSGDEIAIVVFQQIGIKLWEVEWDYTTLTVGTPYILDAATGGSLISLPRIDANDDAGSNSTTSGNAYYKVAAPVYNAGTGYSEIRTYDNVLGSFNYFVSSATVGFPISYSPTPPYNHYAPTVAFVGHLSGSGNYDGSEYMVSHFTHNSGGGGTDEIFAEMINYGSSSVLSGGTYYWVGDNPAINVGLNFVSACAPVCNNNSYGQVQAWAAPNSSNIDVKFRIGTCCYGFKQSNGKEPVELAGKEWKLYPNPADNELMISYQAAAGGTYAIYDVMGRIFLQGSMHSNSEVVNIASLAPGNYIVKMRGNDGSSTTKMMVKDNQ